MTKLIAFHSYRGGTGTTTLTANVAACVARYGYRVGLLDLNWAAPGLPVLFGFGEEGVDRSLQDYLQAQKPWEEVAYDVTFCLGSTSKSASKLYLIPGAPFPHWSLVGPDRHNPPTVTDTGSAGTDLESAALAAAPIAAPIDPEPSPTPQTATETADPAEDSPQASPPDEPSPNPAASDPSAAPPASTQPPSLSPSANSPTEPPAIGPSFLAEPPPAPAVPPLISTPADPVANLAPTPDLSPDQLPHLQAALTNLGETLKLDYLFVDTPSGFTGAIWQAIAPSQVLLLILRPDQQDYPGTALSIQLAQQLKIPRCLLVVNPAPKTLDGDKLKAKLEEAYGLTVASVLPHSTRMMALASADLFVSQHADHPLTQGLEAMARLVML